MTAENPTHLKFDISISMIKVIFHFETQLQLQLSSEATLRIWKMLKVQWQLLSVRKKSTWARTDSSRKNTVCSRR